MPVFVPAQRDLLACDLVVSADGGQWEEDQPALLLGLRGLCALQIDVRGAKGDVHSGSFGGTFQNPIHALSHPDRLHAQPGGEDSGRGLLRRGAAAGRSRPGRPRRNPLRRGRNSKRTWG